MLIKKMFEAGDLPIEKIIFREQRRLNLNPVDCFVLGALFSGLKRKTYSPNVIAKRLNISVDEVGMSIENLIDKGLLTLSLEEKDGKAREIFSLDLTFEKLAELYLIEVVKPNHETSMAMTIDALEAMKKKVLTANEIERVKGWYEANLYSHQDIIKTINELTLLGITRVSQVETTLINKQTQSPKKTISKNIDELFKSI